MRSLTRQTTAFSYLAPYFSINVATAVSAVARSGAAQTSRRSDLATGWIDLGILSSMLAVLCTVQLHCAALMPGRW